MSSAEAYAAAYPSCMLALGDLNGDGQVNTFDIDLFVDVMGGNLMSARRYQYDEENRLTAVAEIDGNPLLEIEYDALGRRIATIDYEAPGGPQQMRHVYSGLNTVAEYVWSGSQWTLGREVLWGERFPEPLALFDFTAAGDEQAGTEEVLHYVHDALGSVVGLVDAGDPDATPEPVPPKLVERYDYDPYGKTYIESWDASAGGGSGAWVRTTASAYGNPFAWTGQRYDAGVGMYHFPFRSFSPELGRWMQRDPLGYINGPNAYAYARSMAVSVTDPLGLFVWIPPWIWGPLGPFGGDDDPMGPPLPPAPDPCGGGPAIADPEGAFGGPGGGDSGGGDSGGEQGGGGGGTNDTQPLPPPPPPPVFPPPQPPTPPVNPTRPTGAGSSGSGKYSGGGEGQTEGGGEGTGPSEGESEGGGELMGPAAVLLGGSKFVLPPPECYELLPKDARGFLLPTPQGFTRELMRDGRYVLFEAAPAVATSSFWSTPVTAAGAGPVGLVTAAGAAIGCAAAWGINAGTEAITGDTLSGWIGTGVGNAYIWMTGRWYTGYNPSGRP